MRKPLVLTVVLVSVLCFAGCRSGGRLTGLAGDWDVYIALSAEPKFGFEWRRMGFAHFAGSDSGNAGFSSGAPASQCSPRTR
jgi:hypothetical protein